MKKNILVSLLLTISVGVFAQSTGMRALKDRFKGEPDVHSFKLGGFLARTVFNLAGEYEYKEAITDIRGIELITIPQDVFKSQNVSVAGYKKFLQENHFEQLIEVKDNGEVVTIYTTPDAGKHERYLIVVDGGHEVVVIELKGHIDPSKLSNVKINTANL